MDIFDSDSSSTENEEIEKNDQQKDNDLCLSEISDMLTAMKIYLEENGLVMLDRKKTMKNLIEFIENI